MSKRFYFHVRQDRVLFEDKHGAEFADLAAAWAWAVQDARTLMKQDAVEGAIERKSIEIADASGAVVGSLPLPARSCIDSGRRLRTQRACSSRELRSCDEVLQSEANSAFWLGHCWRT